MNDKKRAPRLADVGDPRSMAYRLREKRDVRLRELIKDAAKDKHGPIRILDVGGSVQYWRRVGLDFLREHKATVEVVNITETELRASAMVQVMMYAFPAFTARVGDACNLFDVADGAFDLVHSNSVIEHVGSWSNMKAFAKEIRRTARRYYVQTPNFWFPIDPHHYRAPMIHWLPRQIGARLMMRFPICWAGRLADLDDAYTHLDHSEMIDHAQFSFLFPDAQIVPERAFGLVKSWIAIGLQSPAG